jgi:hypothetical protein
LVFFIHHYSYFQASFVYVDMHMGTQARKVSEVLKADCYSDADCKSRCSPHKGTCEAGVCVCVHLQPTLHSKIPSVRGWKMDYCDMFIVFGCEK